MGKPGALPDELKDYIEKYDVFEDWPYPIIWKELFDCFPESQFILSKRLNAETWLKSLQKHTDRNQNKKSQELRLIFFKQDCPHKNDNHYLQYYRNHNKNVISYFGNSSNFCELTVGSNMNWRNLCEFHDLPIPKVEFPYLNNSIEKTGIMYKFKKWMKKKIRQKKF